MLKNEHPLHLYVVEDDVALRDMLSAYLDRQGMGVTAFANAEAFQDAYAREKPDLLILDVGLPGLNGLDLCRSMRSGGDQLPIILLTARSEEIDRVLGLEMGADDYLSKPFSARELVARVRAVLRRYQGGSGESIAQNGVRIGAHAFVPESRSLVKGDDFRVLNPVEFALLSELVAQSNVPVSRERLIAVSHDDDDDVTPRAVDAAIMRLRRVVEPDPAQPRFIQTVRGQGYVFVPQGG